MGKDVITDFRKPGSKITGKDILDVVERFPRPPHLVKHFTENAPIHWKEILQEDLGRKPTDGEFKQYYDYGLDQAAKEFIQGKNEDKAPVVWVNIQPETLKKILKAKAEEDRCLKTLFLTKISGSVSSNIEDRANAQKALLGLPFHLPARLRPLSGFFTDDPNGKVKGPDPGNLKAFGGARLRTTAKDRSFFIMYDASVLVRKDMKTPIGGFPARTDKPNKNCFPHLDWYSKQKFQKNKQNPVKVNSIQDFKPWTEAIILGGVKIDYDVPEIVFDNENCLDGESELIPNKQAVF